MKLHYKQPVAGIRYQIDGVLLLLLLLLILAILIYDTIANL